MNEAIARAISELPPRGGTLVALPTGLTIRPAARAASSEYIAALKEYAELLYKGGLAPSGVGRAEGVAAVLEVGRDLGLPDSQALANVMIVNGRASIWGDAGMAMVRRSGLLEDINEYTEGEGDNAVAVCVVKRRDAKRERTVRFSMADAKRAGLTGKKGPWQTNPGRMLMWKARNFAVRDEFQDVLMGLNFREAEEDEGSHAPAASFVGQGEGSRSAVPVQVIDVRADVPATVAPAAALPPAPQEPPAGPTIRHATASEATAPEPTVPMTRDELMQSVADLKSQHAAKVLGENVTADAVRKLWAAELSPWNVTTIRDLDDTRLAEFHEALMKKVIPF